jgi:hypothetical protein
MVPMVPLDVAEVGWTTARTAEAARASRLARFARNLPRSSCRVEVPLPHTGLTAESNRGQPEDWFGIAQPGRLPEAVAPRISARGQGRSEIRVKRPGLSRTNVARVDRVKPFFKALAHNMRAHIPAHHGGSFRPGGVSATTSRERQRVS